MAQPVATCRGVVVDGRYHSRVSLGTRGCANQPRLVPRHHWRGLTSLSLSCPREVRQETPDAPGHPGEPLFWVEFFPSGYNKRWRYVKIFKKIQYLWSKAFGAAPSGPYYMLRLNNMTNPIICICAVSCNQWGTAKIFGSSSLKCHQFEASANCSAHSPHDLPRVDTYSFNESVSLSYKQLRCSVLHDKPAKKKWQIPAGGLDFIHQAQVQKVPLTIMDFLTINWSWRNIFQN